MKNEIKINISINIIPSDKFKREAKALSKRYYSFEDDLELVINEIRNNPTSGTPLGHNIYKIRFSIKSKNKGKSGGARLITLVKIIENNVYLLSVYDKSNKDSIYDDELLKIIKEIP